MRLAVRNWWRERALLFGTVVIKVYDRRNDGVGDVFIELRASSDDEDDALRTRRKEPVTIPVRFSPVQSI